MLVTGAAVGMGRAIAVQADLAGAEHVVVADINTEGAEQTVAGVLAGGRKGSAGGGGAGRRGGGRPGSVSTCAVRRTSSTWSTRPWPPWAAWTRWSTRP